MGKKLDTVLEFVFDNPKAMASLTVLAIIGIAYISGAFRFTEWSTSFDGTITDIKHQDNWVWIFDTEDYYHVVVVNGSDERRVTVLAEDFEQDVFGQVAKEQKFSVGDNVTLYFRVTKLGQNEPSSEKFQDIIRNNS